MGKMRGEYKLPSGLEYYDDFLTSEEEQELLDFIIPLNYQKVVLHGVAAKRTVVHYGYKYDYERVTVAPGEPFPPLIERLKEKCSIQSSIPADQIVQCLISYYPEKATIGWHRDKFIFGPKVIGISLQSSCFMRFQYTDDSEKRFVYEKELLPRSLYVLGGSARFKWEHSIPAVKQERYSITFRTLRIVL